jgi:predicted Zn-dependent protease
MGLRKLFSGKTPQAFEQKGDSYCAAQAWGKAKIEYERALNKLEKTSSADPADRQRLVEKIHQTKENLALDHKQTAENLIEAGYVDDAQQYIALALDLTENPQLIEEIRQKQQDLENYLAEKIQSEFADIDVNDEATADEALQTTTQSFAEAGDDYFNALVGRLPEEIQAIYLSYGEDFKAGYSALNQGDFELAANHLAKAMADQPAKGSFINIELATAYLNLGNYNDARSLLEEFVQHHPDALPGYQLLCEVYWEMKEFHKADQLLSACPAELAESVAFFLLKGETLFQAQNYSQAKSLYLEFLKNFGWNESIARSLAKTHEALEEMANARNIYREIMQQCQSCRARIDPYIKQKYADLCFSSGIYSTEVLELYLSLAQEVKENAADYYEKISRIYAAGGNEEQAARFRAIAEKLPPANSDPT